MTWTLLHHRQMRSSVNSDGVFLALHGLFGVGCGAIVRPSAGGIAAYAAATFVSLLHPRVRAWACGQVHA